MIFQNHSVCVCVCWGVGRRRLRIFAFVAFWNQTLHFFGGGLIVAGFFYLVQCFIAMLYRGIRCEK